MSTHDPLRVGLVGAGGLGMAHAREVSKDPRSALVAVADVSTDALADAGSELDLSGDALFEEYESMLDAASLDAVVVATPHTLHYGQVVEALDRGLDVLCEKPLVTDVDRAADLVERAESAGRVLLPGYQRRFWTPYVWAREWWAEHGSVPTYVDVAITQDWGDPDSWRSDPELSGGGMLYDTGSHLLDAMLWITDLTPSRVSAEMSFADEERRIDSTASVQIAFEEGATAQVYAAGDVGAVYERIDGRNPESTLVLDGEGWRDRTVRASTGGEKSVLSTERETHPTTRAFLDVVVDGEEPAVTPYDAYRVTVLAEAAYAAARSASSVEVGVEDREALF